MNEEFKRQKIDTCLGGYKMVILNRGWFLSPKGHFAVSGVICGCHDSGSGVISMSRGGGCCQHPMMHRTAATTKNGLKCS